MCDPVTIAGLALSAGGMVASSAAQGQVDSARSDTMSRERGRQQQFDSQAFAVNDKSRSRYDDFGGTQDGKAKELADFYKAQGSDLPTSGATAGEMPPPGSNIVVQEGKKQLERVDKFGQQQDEAVGKLRSFGDAFGNIEREQSKDAGEVGAIGSFRRGSQAVLPLEMEDASHAGDGLKLFGDILSGAGTVTSLAGLSGVGSAAKATTPAGMAMPHGARDVSPGFFSRIFGG